MSTNSILVEARKGLSTIDTLFKLTEAFCGENNIDLDKESFICRGDRRFIFFQSMSHDHSIMRTWRYEIIRQPGGEFEDLVVYDPTQDSVEDRREKIIWMATNHRERSQQEIADFFCVSQALVNRIIHRR